MPKQRLAPTLFLGLGLLVGLTVTPGAAARPLPGQVGGGACAPAPYYRVFRGERRADLHPEVFRHGLNQRFVPSGVQAHSGKGLSAYLVALAPENKPAGLADEFSFLVFPSEQVYQARRQSPEVKAFGELHWAFFAMPPRSQSETAKPLGATILPEVPVDLLGLPCDWQSGHTEFFVGQRLPGVPACSFLDRLGRHVRQSKLAFAGQGMQGYVFVANESFEVAWIHWRSREAAEKARNSPIGRATLLEGSGIMRTVQWASAKPFAGAIAPGEVAQVQVQPPPVER